MSPPLTAKSPVTTVLALLIVAVPVAAPIDTVVAAPNKLPVVAAVLNTLAVVIAVVKSKVVLAALVATVIRVVAVCATAPVDPIVPVANVIAPPVPVPVDKPPCNCKGAADMFVPTPLVARIISATGVALVLASPTTRSVPGLIIKLPVPCVISVTSALLSPTLNVSALT